MLKEVQNVSSCLQKKDTKLILNEKRKQKKLPKKEENFLVQKKNLVERKEEKNENQGSVKKRKMRVKC